MQHAACAARASFAEVIPVIFNVASGIIGWGGVGLNFNLFCFHSIVLVSCKRDQGLFV